MSKFINPHKAQPTSLLAIASSVVRNRQLIFQMTKREVVGRYKGSVFGLTWSFLHPILMLTIYTFVFSVIFKARWGESLTDSKTQFAILVFAGMIVQGLFSEVANRAPSLILSNTNYVKKVVFPLEILPIISMAAALFHALISIFVLLIAFILFNGYLSWTVIFIPLIFLPYVILVLGFSWILASLGVFMRDVGQAIGILTTAMMFMSPVFYPVNALPAKYQIWMLLNPLTFIIEQFRSVLVAGQLPDWSGLGIYSLIALMFMWVGFIWFQRTRKGFSDVL